MRTEAAHDAAPDDGVPPHATSARALRNVLRATAARLAADGGRKLNEGARRVLARLEGVAQAGGMHRAYLKTGKRVVLWDLVSDQELVGRGYVVTRQRSCPILSDDALRQDRVTCWISEYDAVGELWVGEPLVS